MFGKSTRLRCGVLFLTLSILSGCSTIRPPAGVRPRTVVMEATGYCACGQCCGWHRSWIPPFRPVFSSGPLEGKPKKVGITASGTRAKPGTVAADTRHYPFGTVLYILGYGYAKVEDRGGAIQGPARLDLFFKSHQDALNWGRRRVPVQVWRN
jgi:3D (Asp-Asp-Asp) domain-containing protein